MKLRQRRIALLVLVTAAALSLGAATNPLNPLVTRNAQPSGPVPAECAEGIAPAPVPRVEIPDIPLPSVQPAEAVAPPSGSLRAALESTQRALARNDRPAFDESLATAKSLLANYPSGAERRSGEDLVRVYDATAKLWDAQYQSPFFDDTSAEYALVRNFPGYENAVRRSTLTREGRRYFPAAESRDFLGRVAAERLGGIGIHAPAPRLARNERPGVPDVPRVQSSAPRTSRPRRTTTTTARSPRPPRSSAPSRPRLTETRTPAPVTSTPPSPNPAAPPTTAAAPAPATPATGTSSSPATASPATEEPPTSETTATETMATETTATVAPVPTDTTPTAPLSTPGPADPSRTRSVVLPTILILIGLGVLILLFRASK